MDCLGDPFGHGVSLQAACKPPGDDAYEDAFESALNLPSDLRSNFELTPGVLTPVD
jgi:hypothetical protein